STQLPYVPERDGSDMPEKTPADKMRVKPGTLVALVDVPADIEALLGISEGVVRASGPEFADTIFIAAATRLESEERLTAVASAVGPGARLWIAYPKGAKAAGRDVSRDTIMAFAPSVGLVANANIAIDSTWSTVGLRRA
ncbi:MAG: hypothetical protein ACYC6C_05105, partial [Coriobacteriia bacterium]